VADSKWDKGRILLIKERINLFARDRRKMKTEAIPVWILG
jgi:hypothetical protein